MYMYMYVYMYMYMLFGQLWNYRMDSSEWSAAPLKVDNLNASCY